MASGGTLYLSNSNFLQTHTKYYNELLESQEMSDVTLACDGYEVGAHKTIISGSSEFFKEVIRKSKHPNPYIYVKGISKETLETVLKFIYVGEATARTENLKKIVEAGNELKVFGLMEEPLKKQNSVSNKNYLGSSVDMNTEMDSVETEQNLTNVSDINDSVRNDQCELEEADESKDDSDSSRSHLMTESLMTEINKRITTNVDDLGNTNFKCNVCTREFSAIGNIRHHVETHLEAISYKCKFCDVVKRTRKTLHYHQKRYHKSVNNKLINTEKQKDDKDDNKTETQDIKKEVVTTHGKVAKEESNEDNEESKTNIETEKDMDVVCEDKDRAQVGKTTMNVVIGEIVDDSNKERFEKELESLIITGEGNNHYECKVCQKELKHKVKLKLHAETHLEGFSHKCKYCETVKKTMRSIQMHEYEQHRKNETKM